MIADACRHCHRPDNLIEGDGPVRVCRACVRALGEMAGDPSNVAPYLLDTMLDRHGDVVELVHLPGLRLEWKWVGW